MHIRLRDLDLPDGLCIADDRGVHAWDDDSANLLALNAMLLAQGAQRAEAMLAAQREESGRGAAAEGTTALKSN